MVKIIKNGQNLFFTTTDIHPILTDIMSFKDIAIIRKLGVWIWKLIAVC